MPRPVNAPRLGGNVESKFMSDSISPQPSGSEPTPAGMAEVFEDAIDLHIDLVDTVPLDAENLESLAAYPFPLLNKRGEQETRRFRTVILENDYLRATFVPALGGRLLSLFDKRVSREVLKPDSEFVLEEVYTRNAGNREGLFLDWSESERYNLLGNVDYRPVPPSAEDDPAAAWFAEVFAPDEKFGRLSLSWCVGVAPLFAALEWEVRIGNRARGTTIAHPAIALGIEVGSSADVQAPEGFAGTCLRLPEGGLGILFEEGELEDGYDQFFMWSIRRNSGPKGLASRQQDRFRVTFIPYSFAQSEPEIPAGTVEMISVSESGVARMRGSVFCFHATKPILGAKLEVLTEEGSFAAPVDFHPEKPATVALDGVPGRIHTVALVSSSNHVLCTIKLVPTEFNQVPIGGDDDSEEGIDLGQAYGYESDVVEDETDADGPIYFSELDEDDEDDEDPYEDFPMAIADVKDGLEADDPLGHRFGNFVEIDWANRETSALRADLGVFSRRVPAAIELAIRATIATDYAKADALLDQVLTWNGDDPLAWWQKAVIRRLGSLQEEGEEDVARMNAHFLSPLEPALRAEAFLSMEQTHGKDPHPLVEPLTDNPENLVEVACLYIEHGFYVDAGRWIDEALRHKDLAILHYLQAFLFLTQSQMKAQAAEHLSRAAKAQETPLPWRPIERKAIQALVEAFPTDSRLKRLQTILDQVFSRT